MNRSHTFVSSIITLQNSWTRGLYLVITSCTARAVGWSVVLHSDSGYGTKRHLALTAGRDANVVQAELLIASTKEPADGVDVRPLLDAARSWSEQRVYELTRGRPGTAIFHRRNPGSIRLVWGALVTADSLVEGLREVRCLEQLDDESLPVDGERAPVALREGRTAVHFVVAACLKQSVSSQVDCRVTTFFFQPTTHYRSDRDLNKSHDIRLLCSLSCVRFYDALNNSLLRHLTSSS